MLLSSGGYMYIIPICNCGEPLYIYNEEVIKVYQPVTKRTTFKKNNK